MLRHLYLISAKKTAGCHNHSFLTPATVQPTEPQPTEPQLTTEAESRQEPDSGSEWSDSDFDDPYDEDIIFPQLDHIKRKKLAGLSLSRVYLKIILKLFL